ncbi:MAG: hypothetical protein HFE76_10405 [Firmicutes bacterium]|nr:hypothetical protein [Bacillota bacterium]
MGGGIIGKFIYFWIFLLGGLFIAKFLGIADTARNMAVLSLSLAIVYIGWNVLRAKGQQKAAERKPAPALAKQNHHKKKKR